MKKSGAELLWVKNSDPELAFSISYHTPYVLKNENIFKREAIRYELDGPKEEIRMIGTVFSEDFGFLTDMSMEAVNNLVDALYPEQYASHAIGRAHRNYQNLTYEAVLDTYRRYYHFDNSLLFLYGDMDYERILSFLDKEYLSATERQEADLSVYQDSAAEDGYVETTVFVPAYEGDQTENASEIDYAFSLEDKSWEDLPGLAETILGEQEAYLADRKASMTEEDIRQMILDTKEFMEWNESESSNSDFMIDPSDIPDEEPYMDYEKTNGDGAAYYMASAEAENAGRYRMYLDTSDFSDEEKMDLGLYSMLAGNMGTRDHSLEEILNLKSEYLYSYEMESLYPDGEEAYPMMRLDWVTLTEDYEAELTLLLEMLGSTDFTDTKQIQELPARESDFYDRLRTGDKLSVARDLAASYVYRDYAYQEAYRRQEFYYYLEDIKNKLEEDSAYGAGWAERLRSVSDKLMKKGRLVSACAAPESDLETIKTISAGMQEALPSKEAGESSIPFPQKMQMRSVILESSDQCAVTIGNCYEADGFSGKYVPFLMAADDWYTVPKFRFQMGAYSSGINFLAYSGAMLMYNYSDPNAAETIKVFEGKVDAIAAMKLTEKELDGYILTAVTSSDMARGVFTEPLMTMENEIVGRDTRKACEVANTMKFAVLEDQKAVSEYFREVLNQSGTVIVGNETQLKADPDAFDQLLSYKERESGFRNFD